MRKFALFATLAGAVSLAAPLAHADRDDWRHEQAGMRDARARHYVTLAAMDIHRKETVDIDRNLGSFRELRVQAIRGAAYVDFIEVRYGNGEQQHIDVKRRLGRDEVATVDLNGSRHIEAITVHGEPDHWSQIQVIGIR
jgi:hypothetical protein